MSDARWTESIARSLYSRGVVIPYLDHPLGAAGQEHGGHVLIPGDVVDRRVVRRVRLQVLRAVLRGALVDKALVGANEKHAAVVRVEGDASTAL